MHSVTEPDYWWDAVESRFGDRRLPLMLLALAFAGALRHRARLRNRRSLLKYRLELWSRLLGAARS